MSDNVKKTLIVDEDLNDPSMISCVSKSVSEKKIALFKKKDHVVGPWE